MRSSRAPGLVANYTQLSALAGKPPDGTNEIAATRGIHPARTQDQVPASRALDRLLALELAAAIFAHRIGRIILQIRRALLTVENVVRRVVDQQRAAPARFRGENPRCATV